MTELYQSQLEAITMINGEAGYLRVSPSQPFIYIDVPFHTTEACLVAVKAAELLAKEIEYSNKLHQRVLLYRSWWDENINKIEELRTEVESLKEEIKDWEKHREDW